MEVTMGGVVPWHSQKGDGPLLARLLCFQLAVAAW